ncbi:MAG TPA: hypothetical protein VFI95_01035 [Terriglobales bacterium]|nr:hypothetical protein [Terriglobales bacterium]
MNFFQAFNLSVFVGTLGTLAGGLSRIPAGVGDWRLANWLFIAFFLLFRLKMVLDDHQYFAKAKTKNVNFKIGFVTAVASWLFWALAGYSIGQLQQAYFLVGIAISISTLWILAVALLEGATSEHYFWIAANTVIIVLLWGAYRRNASTSDWVTWLLLGGILVLVIADFIYSKSVPELDQ